MPLPAPEPSTLTVMSTQDDAVEVMASPENFFGETSVSIRRKSVQVEPERMSMVAIPEAATEQV